MMCDGVILLMSEVCMGLEILFEDPQNIGDFDFSKNKMRQLYSEYLNNKKNIFLKEIYPHGRLIKNGSKYLILDDNLLAVTYYMESAFRKVKGREAAYQRLVWRDTDVPDTRLHPHEILFEYLLPLKGILASDRQQSTLGKRFWFIAVGMALQKGLHVYFIDLNKNDGFITIHNGEELREKEREIWGDHEKHQANLLVISEKALQPVMGESLDSFGIPKVE